MTNKVHGCACVHVFVRVCERYLWFVLVCLSVCVQASDRASEQACVCVLIILRLLDVIVCVFVHVFVLLLVPVRACVHTGWRAGGCVCAGGARMDATS